MQSTANHQTESLLRIEEGRFLEKDSHLSSEIVCLPLQEAMEVYGVFLQKRLKVNESSNGAFLYIPPNIQVSLLKIEQKILEKGNPSLVISLGKNASVKIEQSWLLGETVANSYLDISLDTGSSLELKNIQRKAPGAVLFQKTRGSLKRDSKLIFRNYLEGAKKAKQDIQIELLDENAEALLEGVTNLEDDCISEICSFVRHLSPHARSRQHFKALLNHASKSSFEGTIYVHPTAQKTESYQLSNNLLLSNEAKAFVQPNLEIFADDVKASHGATVTQVDKEALFYLTSRGVSKDAARDFLVKGFIHELSKCLP